MEHLTDEELHGYRERSLEPARLLAVDDHLAACKQCLVRLSSELAPHAPLQYLRAELRPRHFEYEQLEAYAEGRLKDADALAHLESCRDCRAEADDLRTFALQIQPRKLVRKIWLYGWAAAAAAAAILLVFVHLTRPPSSPQAIPVQQAASKPALPSAYEALIASTSAAGTIAVPPQIAVLAGHRNQLMGAPGEQPKFAVIGPVGTAVLTATPEFRWQPLAGARSYHVAVYDANYNPVVTSPALTETSWRASKPFAVGKVYSWQVTALAGGQEVAAPQPPMPEAKFTLLPEAEAKRLESARAQHPDAHLALGILFGQAGAVEESAAELKQAIAAGDHADTARKLLASLHRNT